MPKIGQNANSSDPSVPKKPRDRLLKQKSVTLEPFGEKTLGPALRCKRGIKAAKQFVKHEDHFRDRNQSGHFSNLAILYETWKINPMNQKSEKILKNFSFSGISNFSFLGDHISTPSARSGVRRRPILRFP